MYLETGAREGLEVLVSAVGVGTGCLMLQVHVKYLPNTHAIKICDFEL